MVELLSALLLLAQPAPVVQSLPAPVLPPDTKPYFRANNSPACINWNSARASKTSEDVYRSAVHKRWVLGYISGFNVAGPDPTGDLLATSSANEFFGAVDGYCSRNPSNDVVYAMRPVASAIIRRRGTPALAISNSTVKKRAQIVGPDTCQDWSRNRDDKMMRLAYLVWLHGYITAKNQWGSDPLGDAIGNGDATEIIADQWCKEHPSARLVGVITPMIEHFAAERLARRLPPGGKGANDKLSPNR